MSEQIVHVNLGPKSYDIRISNEPDCLQKWSREFMENRKPSGTAVITNDTVCTALPEQAGILKQASANLIVIKVPDGEAHKNLQTWEHILSDMLRKKLDRNAIVLAFGGGVVGDVAGFAASAYRRGIAYVQVPTTLLAMVDSSVGGKTAVDHALGKNLIGAFWQPAEVWIDLDTLKTLPHREFLAGMAEVIKYGFVGGADFYQWIDTNIEALLKKDPDILFECICRSCRFKADIVEKDEREGGLRAILNYGHTFGHALESVTGYDVLLHGEGVTYGMKAAAHLAFLCGRISKEFLDRHLQVCDMLMLPAAPPVPVQQLVRAMEHDKKVEGGKIKLILAKSPGEVEKTDCSDAKLLTEAWMAALRP